MTARTQSPTPTSFSNIRGFRMFAQMRGVQQLALFKEWGRLRGDALLPPATAELGQSLRRSKDELVVFEAQATNQLDTLRIRYLGPNLKKLWPSTALGSRLLGKDVPAIERACAEDFVYVLTCREPHYRCLSLDVNGVHPTYYERLILPFGTRQSVTSMVCVFGLVSEGNGYPNNILTHGRIVAGLAPELKRSA